MDKKKHSSKFLDIIRAPFPKKFFAQNGDVVTSSVEIKYYKNGKYIKRVAKSTVNQVVNNGIDVTAERL